MCIVNFFFFSVLVNVDSLPEPICSMKGDLLKHLLTFRTRCLFHTNIEHTLRTTIPLSEHCSINLTFTKEKFNMINSTNNNNNKGNKKRKKATLNECFFFFSSSAYCIWFASTCIHIDEWATSIKCVLLVLFTFTINRHTLNHDINV